MLEATNTSVTEQQTLAKNGRWALEAQLEELMRESKEARSRADSLEERLSNGKWSHSHFCFVRACVSLSRFSYNLVRSLAHLRHPILQKWRPESTRRRQTKPPESTAPRRRRPFAKPCASKGERRLKVMTPCQC